MSLCRHFLHTELLLLQSATVQSRRTLVKWLLSSNKAGVFLAPLADGGVFDFVPPPPIDG